MYLSPGGSIVLVRYWVFSLWFNCSCALVLVLQSWSHTRGKCFRFKIRQTNNPIDLAWITWWLKQKHFPTSHGALENRFCKDSLQNWKCSQCLMPGSHLGWGGVSSCTGAMCSSLSPSQAVKHHAKGWQQIRICDEQETSLPGQSEEMHFLFGSKNNYNRLIAWSLSLSEVVVGFHWKCICVV